MKFTLPLAFAATVAMTSVSPAFAFHDVPSYTHGMQAFGTSERGLPPADTTRDHAVPCWDLPLGTIDPTCTRAGRSFR